MEDEQRRRMSDTARLYQLRAEKLFEKLAPVWCKNLRQNIHNPGVLSNHQLIDVPLSPGAKHGRKAWIFASGASLKQYEENLAELIGNDFCLVSPTAAPWFVVHAKRLPDVVFAIDRSEVMLTDCMTAGLKGRPVRNKDGEIVDYDGPPLVAATTALNVLVRYFAPRVYWYNSLVSVPSTASLPYPNLEKLKEEGKTTEEIDKIMAKSVQDAHAVGRHISRQKSYSDFITWTCGHLKVGIDQMGCVTNEAMVVVLALLNFDRLEAKDIILAGADYGYWNGLARVPKGTRDPEGNIDLDPYTRYEDDPDNADFLTYHGIATNSRMLGYTSDMVNLWGSPQSAEWQHSGARLWRLSSGPGESILEGTIPAVSPEQLMSEEYPEYPSDEEIRKTAKAYLEEFQSEYAELVGYNSEVISKENFQ